MKSTFKVNQSLSLLAPSQSLQRQLLRMSFVPRAIAKVLIPVMVLTPLLAIGGCANTAGRNVQQSVQQQQLFGTVSSIQVINNESRGISGGAILGAVLGGVVGHQIGGGTGRTLATGAGVIGGALAGNEISNRTKGDNQLYRVTVRQNNGRTQQFDYQQIGDLQVGDSVRIDNGQIFQL